MKRAFLIMCFAGAAAAGLAIVTGDLSEIRGLAQTKTMPETIVLGPDVKLGPVTFSHASHNNGTYKVNDAAIACTTCHHTARSAEEAAKDPVRKTVWPADRTTSLTLELFNKDAAAAGVAACRDCHAKAGATPKLIAKIPEMKSDSGAVVSLNNQQALHKNCASCHADVKKAIPAAKGPTTTQCTACHKKAA